MPEQPVDVVDVHVIVVHRVVAVGVTADVPVAVHRCPPSFHGARHVQCGVLLRVWQRWRHVAHLALGVCCEVPVGAVGPSDGISDIASAPSGKRRAPSYASVLPCVAVPQSVGGSHEDGAEDVEDGVGRVELDSRHDALPPALFFFEAAACLLLRLPQRVRCWLLP